jgi:hypothetical protein
MLHCCTICLRTHVQQAADHAIVWRGYEIFLCSAHMPVIQADLDAFIAAARELETAGVDERMAGRILARRVERRELLSTLLEE